MTDTLEQSARETTIEVDGFPLYFQDWGEGPAVVLLHGGGAGAYGYSNYSRNIEALAKTHRVIVPDLPGFGRSKMQPTPNGLFSMMARNVRAILDSLGIEKASIVGNSMGGGTAMRFGLDQPEMLEKLVLMGPAGSVSSTAVLPTSGQRELFAFYARPGGPTKEGLRQLIEKMIFDSSVLTDELLEKRFETATKPETVTNPPLTQMTTLDRELWRENLGRLDHPVLIIWGMQDKVLPMDSAFLLARQMPNADVHLFSKCGHWAQWEKADKFNSLVSSFLN